MSLATTRAGRRVLARVHVRAATARALVEAALQGTDDLFVRRLLADARDELVSIVTETAGPATTPHAAEAAPAR